jgi:hypothetical protein
MANHDEVNQGENEHNNGEPLETTYNPLRPVHLHVLYSLMMWEIFVGYFIKIGCNIQ